MKSLPVAFLIFGSCVVNIVFTREIYNQTTSRGGLQVRRNSRDAAEHGRHANVLYGAEKSLSGPDEIDKALTLLRSTGMDPKVVRDILLDYVRATYGEKRRVLGGIRDDSYWKASSLTQGTSQSTVEIRAQQRKLDEEEEASMRLVSEGRPIELNERSLSFRRAMMCDTSPEKLDQIQRVREDYGDLSSRISSDAHGILSLDDRRALEYLETEQHRELASLLTISEMEQYDLRNSKVAAKVRSQFGSLEISDEQFKALYSLETQNGVNRASSEATKLILGPTLWGDYQLGISPTTRAITQVMRRYDLPKDTVNQVLSLQNQVEEDRLAISNDSSLPASVQESRILTITKNAEAALLNKLGAHAFEAYKRIGSPLLASSMQSNDGAK